MQRIQIKKDQDETLASGNFKHLIRKEVNNRICDRLCHVIDTKYAKIKKGDPLPEIKHDTNVNDFFTTHHRCTED